MCTLKNIQIKQKYFFYTNLINFYIDKKRLFIDEIVIDILYIDIITEGPHLYRVFGFKAHYVPSTKSRINKFLYFSRLPRPLNIYCEISFSSNNCWHTYVSVNDTFSCIRRNNIQNTMNFDACAYV